MNNCHPQFRIIFVNLADFFPDLYHQQKLQQQPVRQDQHSHESGFQSATSLTSLEGPPSQIGKLDSPSASQIQQSSPPGKE